MPRSPLRAKSWISWGREALVVVLLAYYEMLEFWIEYAYRLGMKMSCCLVRACRALLIGPEYIIFEAAVRCLSIAQCTLILEREPRFVPQARPYSQTVLKFGLRWSTAWWRGVTFYHRRPIDHWVFAGGIDCFPIAMSDHADSSGFIVQISLRANPDDR
jgi:hypothetical protein